MSEEDNAPVLLDQNARMVRMLTAFEMFDRVMNSDQRLFLVDQTGREIMRVFLAENGARVVMADTEWFNAAPDTIGAAAVGKTKT